MREIGNLVSDLIKSREKEDRERAERFFGGPGQTDAAARIGAKEWDDGLEGVVRQRHTAGRLAAEKELRNKLHGTAFERMVRGLETRNRAAPDAAIGKVLARLKADLEAETGLEVRVKKGRLDEDGNVVDLHDHDPSDEADTMEQAALNGPMADGEGQEFANTVTWSSWSGAFQKGGGVPGWTFCAFGNRIGPDELMMVQGIVRGGLGIWKAKYAICNHDMTSPDEDAMLYAISHLPSGLGLGLFRDRADALYACDLIVQMVPDIADLNVDDGSELAMFEAHSRIHKAWRAVGITTGDDHIHQGYRTIKIWQRTEAALNEGRPEKLS